MSIIKQQIEEDIKYLKEQLPSLETKRDEYVFNHWVLVYLYSLDEEACVHNVIDGSGDQGIDCFVHYEESKELYIIQNKFYDENISLNYKDISHFLTEPLLNLQKNQYFHSRKLQSLFNEVKTDMEYKVFLHFYISNDKVSAKANDRIKEYNNCGYDKNDENKIQGLLQADLFYLKDIEDKYYGKSYSENVSFNGKLSVSYRANRMTVLPEKHNLPNMSEAYFFMAKVSEIYTLWKDANIKNYPLFSENIRDYLGSSGRINKGIIQTLRSTDPRERSNFFYYNNGITIICDKVIANAGATKLTVVMPKIVNGCQTVSSIATVLKDISSEEDLNEKYGETYVMVKVLDLEDKKDITFRENVVKYTNSQNSINEKAFEATNKFFLRVQNNLQKKGILVIVKQSDRNTFKEKYRKDQLTQILNIANSCREFYQFKTLANLQIPLEKLLQIIMAFKKDAYHAYVKKSYLLKRDSRYHKIVYTAIKDEFTWKSIVILIMVFKRVEKDRRQKKQRDLSPFYLLNFIGFYIEQESINSKNFLENISMTELDCIYTEFFQKLPPKYFDISKEDYNDLIKKPINENMMRKILHDKLEALEENNDEVYAKLIQIFQKFKTKP